MKHSIIDLAEGISEVVEKIKILVESEGRQAPPECIEENEIVGKVIQKIKFIDEYRDPVRRYCEAMFNEEKDDHDLDRFFRELHHHETEFRRFQAWREARTEKVLAVRPRSGGGHSRQRQREVAKEKESDDAEQDISECWNFEKDGECSYGDDCIFRHVRDGVLINNPSRERQRRKDRKGGQEKGKGKDKDKERTYTAKQMRRKENQIKRMKKKLKKRKAEGDSEEHKSKKQFSEAELEEKISEAKRSAASKYRQALMITHAGIDFPEPQAQALVMRRILAATSSNPDFWLKGRRIGIDTDSSVNIASKNSMFFHETGDGGSITVNGVGGDEQLNVSGQMIIPMRLSDGSVTVLPMPAFRAGKTDVNIISATTLASMGYSLVMSAPTLFPQFAGKNPSSSPDGHALLTRERKPIWLKVVDGILVLELVSVRITPEMIPETDGIIKFRSGKQARKLRTEKAARELRKETGMTYSAALIQTQEAHAVDGRGIWISVQDCRRCDDLGLVVPA